MPIEFLVVMIVVIVVAGRRIHVRLEGTQYATSHQEAKRRALWAAKSQGYDVARVKHSVNKRTGDKE